MESDKISIRRIKITRTEDGANIGCANYKYTCTDTGEVQITDENGEAIFNGGKEFILDESSIPYHQGTKTEINGITKVIAFK